MSKNILRRVLNKLAPFRSDVDVKPNLYISKPSWEYQSKTVLPHHRTGDMVIDVGCGGAPSPIATVLTDFYPDQTIHRARPLMDDRPLIVCRADRMPIRDKFFDFSMCAHVLEHVSDPLSATNEISRISKNGYLETPAYGKDVLIGTGDKHIWQIVSSGDTLHFFPYTARQHEAHRGSAFMDIWCAYAYHPLQEYFWERQDVFNASQLWSGSPKVAVHRLDTILPVGDKPSWMPVDLQLLPSTPPTLTALEISLMERLLVSTDLQTSMVYRENEFVDPSGLVSYPVRGKRVYFEVGT